LEHTASIKAIVEEKLVKRNMENEDNEVQDTLQDTGDGSTVVTNKFLSAKELREALEKEFALAKKEGGPFAQYWDGIVDQIWAFGPRRVGSNLLVNRIPGYVRKSFFEVDSTKSSEVSGDHADEVIKVEENEKALSILDVDFHIHTGFQLSTLTGPLCAEPVTGVCYIVQAVDIHPDDSVNGDGEPVDGNFMMRSIKKKNRN
jgi:ribosome assembly protein 1